MAHEQETTWRVELLQKSHNRNTFDCGEPSLNQYLQRYARQNATAGIGLTFVAVRPHDPTRIFGYFTLAASHIQRTSLPDDVKLPHIRYRP